MTGSKQLDPSRTSGSIQILRSGTKRIENTFKRTLWEMLPSPLLRQQQATLLALLSGVCSKYHFQVRISKLPLETALGCFLPLTWKWDWRSGFSFHETKRFISGEEVLSEKAGIQNSREFYRGPWPVHVIQIIFPGPWAVHAMQICSGFKSPSTGISGSMCIQTFSQSHFIGTYVRIWPNSQATTIIKSSKVRFFENRSHGISAQRYADK